MSDERSPYLQWFDTYAQIEKQSSLDRCSELISLVGILKCMCRNIIDHPCDDKFRRIRMNTNSFRRMVDTFSLRGIRRWMSLIGFKETEADVFVFPTAAEFGPLHEALTACEIASSDLDSKVAALEVQRDLQAWESEIQCEEVSIKDPRKEYQAAVANKGFKKWLDEVLQSGLQNNFGVPIAIEGGKDAWPALRRVLSMIIASLKNCASPGRIRMTEEELAAIPPDIFGAMERLFSSASQETKNFTMKISTTPTREIVLEGDLASLHDDLEAALSGLQQYKFEQECDRMRATTLRRPEKKMREEGEGGPVIPHELLLTATRLVNDIAGLIELAWILEGSVGYVAHHRIQAKELLSDFREGKIGIEQLYETKEQWTSKVEEMKSQKGKPTVFL